jgi:hypothetical protein
LSAKCSEVSKDPLYAAFDHRQQLQRIQKNSLVVELLAYSISWLDNGVNQ